MLCGLNALKVIVSVERCAVAGTGDGRDQIFCSALRVMVDFSTGSIQIHVYIFHANHLFQRLRHALAAAVVSHPHNQKQSSRDR